MIVHPSGRTHNHRRFQALHRPVLVHRRTSAVAAHHGQAGSHRLEHLLDLQGKLARRNHHYRLHASDILAKRHDQGNEIGQRLSRPRRRQQDEVRVILHISLSH